MVISFVTYVKNRRIGSTYPSIDAKPESQATKTLRKLREAIAQKCIAIMNAMPFISPRVSTGLINIIELQGMFQLFFRKRKPLVKWRQIEFSFFLPWNSVLVSTKNKHSSADSVVVDTFLAISNTLKSTTHFNFESLATFSFKTMLSNSWVCRAQLFKIQFKLTNCYIYIVNSWHFIDCFRFTSILRCELIKWADPTKLRRFNKWVHVNSTVWQYNNSIIINNSFWTNTFQNKVFSQNT